MNNKLNGQTNIYDIIKKEKLDVVNKPITEAHGLPNECYISEDYTYQKVYMILKTCYLRHLMDSLWRISWHQSLTQPTGWRTWLNCWPGCLRKC